MLRALVVEDTVPGIQIFSVITFDPTTEYLFLALKRAKDG